MEVQHTECIHNLRENIFLFSFILTTTSWQRFSIAPVFSVFSEHCRRSQGSLHYEWGHNSRSIFNLLNCVSPMVEQYFRLCQVRSFVLRSIIQTMQQFRIIYALDCFALHIELRSFASFEIVYASRLNSALLLWIHSERSVEPFSQRSFCCVVVRSTNYNFFSSKLSV